MEWMNQMQGRMEGRKVGWQVTKKEEREEDGAVDDRSSERVVSFLRSCLRLQSHPIHLVHGRKRSTT